MKNERINRILKYLLVALLSATITATVMFGIFFVNQKNQSKLLTLQQLIEQYFIGEVDTVAMEDAAANAMVNALGDKWSYYIPADEYASYMEQMNNAYVGVGITIVKKDDGIAVESVVSGGPAEEAGVQAGDTVLKVDGVSIAGKSVSEVKNMVQGEEGTTVTFAVSRNGEEISLVITRKEIRTPVVASKMLEGNIGYIQIFNFNKNSAEETIGVIKALTEQGAQKLIFDVRDNPGGYAEEMVNILDYLLPEGDLFTRVDYTGKEYTETSDAQCIELPMAVLVNGSSYSAAEFFAAALAEYEAAVIVGEKTSGKGYYQTTFSLPDGSAVGLSIGKYYTPKGENLADVGITPDIQVTLDTTTQEDEQLQGAIEALS